MSQIDPVEAPPRRPPPAAAPPDRADASAVRTDPRPADRPATLRPAPVEGRINGHHSYPDRTTRRVPWLAIAAAVAGALLLVWLLATAGNDVARVEALDEGVVVVTD